MSAQNIHTKYPVISYNIKSIPSKNIVLKNVYKIQHLYIRKKDIII